MAPNVYTADRRLYLNAEGAVVEADDPARATLLVPEGGILPLERARELGLAGEGVANVADVSTTDQQARIAELETEVADLRERLAAAGQDAGEKPAKRTPANKAKDAAVNTKAEEQ
jgi:hypothetical protein